MSEEKIEFATFQLTPEEAQQFKRRHQLISELEERMYIHQTELNYFASQFIGSKKLDGGWSWDGNDKLVSQTPIQKENLIKLVQ